MRAVRVAQGMAVALGMLAAAGVTGCSAGSAPVAATAGSPASLAASASAAAAASGPPSAPAATSSGTSSPTPGPSGEVNNLVVSSTVRSALLAAYTAYRSIPASDAVTAAGSVYYAYQPATGTYWAKATYGATSGDPLSVQVGFQDGGSDGFFKRTGSGPWQVIQGGVPVICGELRFFPQPVLAAWSLPTTAPAGVC